MSSALKPVLTSAGAQNPQVPSQLNKPMHSQGAPTTYGQPVSHIPQNLVNIPHNPPSTASVHNPAHSNTHSVAHHINTNTHSTSHSANHYSLNVPNASQHYPVSGSTPVSSHSTSISNHPVSNANQSHTQLVSTFSSPPKNPSYNPSFQANLGHSYKPMNVTSNTQNVPTTQTATATSEEPSTEKPQSNGTSEVKLATKTEPPQNHISSPGIKDKPPPPPPPPLQPQLQSQPQTPSSLPEKPKASLEKPANSNTTTTVEPLKQNTDVNKAPENNSATETVAKTSAQAEPISTVTITSTTTTTNSASAAPNADVATSSSETLPSDTAPPVITQSQVAASTTTEATAPTTTTTASSTVETTTTDSTVVTPVASQPLQPAQPQQSAGTEEVQQEPQEPAPTSNTTGAAATAVQNKPKEQNNQKSTLKLATTPRTPIRKAKTPKLEMIDVSKTPTAKNETKSLQKSPGSGGKSKRTRTKTQPYQSPLPEVEMISKITATTPRSKNNEDKLIIFYKNEFLAVRNSEGGFYVCQAMQNIYKSSPRIRIRWLSQDKADKEIYTPDFYDYTDFDCILTNLNLERVDKGKYKLPSNERIRTDSILKRALAVEKGDATPPSLTEEHPDGLDLSLYKEESQLKKRKAVKRKATTPLKTPTKTISTKKSPDQAKVRKVISKPKPQAVKKSTVLKRALSAKVKNPEAARAERAAKRRSPEQPKNTTAAKTSPIIDHKKAKVLAKVARKPPAGPPPKTQPPPKQITKSAKQVVAAVAAATAAPPKKATVITKKEKPVVTTRKSKRAKK